VTKVGIGIPETGGTEEEEKTFLIGDAHISTWGIMGRGLNARTVLGELCATPG